MVFTSPFIVTVKFIVLLWEVLRIKVSQIYENWQEIAVFHAKQRMEMTQNELKIELESRGLENWELERDTNRIQLSRYLKLIPHLTTCLLWSLVRVFLWPRTFSAFILQISHLRSFNEVFAVASKFHDLKIQLQIINTRQPNLYTRK
jgi:hypothetical protein